MKLYIVGFDDEVMIPTVQSISESNHQILKWFGSPKTSSNLSFSNVLVDVSQLSRAESIFGLEKTVLDECIIKDFKHTESLFLDITDRLCFEPISVRKRKKVYYAWLSHWLEALSLEAPEIILFSSTPHMGWDNVLFDVARYKGIQTFVLERTSLAEILIYLDDISIHGKVNPDFLAKKDEDELTHSIPDFIKKALDEEASWLVAAKKINKSTREKFQLSPRKLKNKFFGFINFFLNFNKSENVSGTHLNNFRLSKLKLHFLQREESKNIQKLKKGYQDFTSQLNDIEGKSFVFFPMHYQPERSTLPLAGVYHEHLLALQLLSEYLPKDWLIVVKEHPRQFDINRVILKNRHFRTIEDYRDWSSFKNVRLVPIDSSTDLLIKKAKIIATATGTSGWDGLQLGKPVVTFGEPWYSPCRAVYVIKTKQDMALAMKEAPVLTEKDVKLSVLKFLNWISSKVFIGSFAARFSKAQNRNLDFYAKSLSEATMDLLERIRKN